MKISGSTIRNILVAAFLPGCLCVVSSTHTARAQSNQSADQLVGTGEEVWRCSLDGRFYTVVNQNGVHIRPVTSGQVMAEIQVLTDRKGRIKTDHKGDSKLEGRWGLSTYGGLIVIQGMEADKIHGFLLAPTPGIPASSCNSRTSAAILSFGQPGPICNVLTVSWDLQPGVTIAQAGAAETLAVEQQVNYATTQAPYPNDSNQKLVGTWYKEVFDGHLRYTTTVVLRSDGTYTKALIGTNHSGRWTSSGTVVHLSGDGNYPPTNEDLRLFRRIRE